jgi:predicted naringenin-chalcone synthase
MSSVISAIGVANPRYCFSQEEILGYMTEAHQLTTHHASRLRKIYELSGIDYRYSVLPDFGRSPDGPSFFGEDRQDVTFPCTRIRMAAYQEHAIQVMVRAVQDLQVKLPEFDLQGITHLITVSCTGMYAPGLDIDLLQTLGLPLNTERTCINFMGCYGAFNALKVADYICRADPESKVLIADVELCTLHFQRTNTLENWLANSLFSDGAAAVLVENSVCCSSSGGFYLKTFYNELITEAREEMAWYIGNTGFEMRLSSHIARNIRSRVEQVSGKLTGKAGIRLGDISRLAIHPGGRRILEVCQEILDFPEQSLQPSFDVLKEFGNMSSASVLFVLGRHLPSSQPGEHLMSFAFGPGLTFESMILETA